jgi:DNA-binding NarL/FixJ family response regulator
MRELVLATISDQPDIEIIGEIKDDSEIAHVTAESQPDFVIIALDRTDQRPVMCNALLGRHPQIKVLALAPERSSSVFFWSVVDIHSAPVESSEEGILNALRGKVQLMAS